MARISTYQPDLNVKGDDKWIGSEWNSPTKLTKNFSANAVADYYNRTAYISTGQFAWQFEPYIPTQDQAQKTFQKIDHYDDTIDIINLGGVLRVAQLTLANNEPFAFIQDQWLQKNMLVYKSGYPDIYAIYTVDAVVQDGYYYLMTLTFVDGASGIVEQDESVSFGLFAANGTVLDVTATFPLLSTGGTAPNISVDSGYSIPTDGELADALLGYDRSIISAAVTGTTTKTLTLTKQDGGTITASWSDYDTAPVTSVFGRTGAIVAQAGDYTTDLVTEGSNLYFTNLRARSAISVSATGLTYNSSTGDISLTSGYVIPTTGSFAHFEEAYNNMIVSANVTGTTTKTLTLVQQDGGTITTSWSDYDTAPVTSVFGRTGAITAQSGDYTTTLVTEGTNLYFTDTRARASISVSATGLTYNSSTGDISLTTGYIIPTTSSYSNFEQAYNNMIVSASVTAGATNTLTLNQQDGGTITATWSEHYQGTVTSVGVSMPSAFTVSNSPITSSGTIAITGAGTSAEYIDGTGALQTFPIAGQAGTLVTQVRNETGATLTKGTIVYINGASGNKPTVAKAIATSDATSAQTLGWIQNDIPNNQNGYIVEQGTLTDLDTLAVPAGSQLYLSGTVAGGYTTVKPVAPIHLVYVGIVVRQHQTQGTIEVVIQNGYELDELHNVLIQSPITGDVLTYNASTSLWENLAIPEILGYTPANAATTLTINGTTYDLSANRTWSVGTVTSVAALTLGTSGTDLSSTVATGTTTPIITLNVPTASATNRGALSSADWSTFNSKQDQINGTGFVKASGTTISYDNSTYLTTISGITAGGELSGTYPNPTLVTSAVTGKLLTGLNITGGSIASTDSILNAFGKLQNQINALSGSVIYQGTWNASTNTPTLASGVGTKGYYYIVNVAGNTNLDGNTDWAIGDWAIFDGSAWQKVDNTDSVSSVNGFTGAVSLTTSNIPEGTNLYFTNSRAINSTLTGYTSGPGTITASDTILSAIQKLNGNIGSLTTGVSSVFGRTGAVIAQSGDYTTTQVTEGTNLYFTNARAIASTLTGYVSGAGTISSSDSVLTAIQKLNGNVSALVTGVSSVFGRTGAVTAQSGDYTTTLVTEGTNLYFTNARARQAISLTTTGTSGAATYDNSTGVLNIPQYQTALTNPVTGTGTTNYVPKWTSSSAIGNSIISDDGTNASVAGGLTSSSFIRVNKNGSDSLGSGAFFALYNAGFTSAIFQQLNASNGLDWWNTSGRLMTLTTGGNLGIGTTAPTYKLVVSNGGAEGIEFIPGSTTNVNIIQNYNRNSGTWETLDLRANDYIFRNQGTEAMRINTTGNVSIGNTNNTYKLDVSGTGYFSGQLNVMGYFSAYSDSTTLGSLGFNRNVSNGAIYNSSYGAYQLQNGSGLFEIFGFNSAGSSLGRLLALNSSGNLGLGVTPSAWNASGTVMQIGTNGTFALENYSGVAFNITQNGYRPSGITTHYYTTSAPASNYYQYNGGHAWQVAPSGTAGSAISFTQAMTLDASGNLALGVSSPLTGGGAAKWMTLNGVSYSGGIIFSLAGVASSYTYIDTDSNYAIQGQSGIGFKVLTNGSEKLRVDTSGNLMVGTTSAGGYKLNVNGTGYFGGSLTVNSGVYKITGATIGSGSERWLGTDGGAGWFFNTPTGSNITFGINNANNFNISGTGQATFSSSVTATRLVIGQSLGLSSQLEVYSASYGNLAAFRSIPSDGINSYLLINTSSSGVTLEESGSSYGALMFKTGASERMRITSGGNVLIGTTTDSGYKLDVNGTGRFSGTSALLYLNNTTATTGKAWRFSSASNGNFYLTQDGVVDALTLAVTTGAATFSSSVTAGYYDGAIFRVYTSSTFRGGLGTGSWAFGDGTNDIALTSDAAIKIGAGGSERMRITSGGNVLIGTTTDSGYKLNVNGTGYFSSSVNATIFVSGSGANQTVLNAGNLLFYNAASSAKYIQLADDASTINAIGFSKSGSTATTWFPSGNVGIGTTSPSTLLHISTGAGGQAKLTLEEGGAQSVLWATRNSSTNGDLRFQTMIGGTISTRMLIDYSGNVGIGTTSPSYKLDVAGSVGATAYYETSDIRFKDVLEVNPKVDLSSLALIKYKLKDSDEIRYGYSAQDVQALCGDLVGGAADKLTLNYKDIHSIKIAALEAEVKELKAQLNLK